MSPVPMQASTCTRRARMRCPFGRFRGTGRNGPVGPNDAVGSYQRATIPPIAVSALHRVPGQPQSSQLSTMPDHVWRLPSCGHHEWSRGDLRRQDQIRVVGNRLEVPVEVWDRSGPEDCAWICGWIRPRRVKRKTKCGSERVDHHGANMRQSGRILTPNTSQLRWVGDQGRWEMDSPHSPSDSVGQGGTRDVETRSGHGG